MGVSRVSAMRWYRAWRKGGLAALATARPLGRPARLSAQQISRVEQQLLKGAAAHGYSTDLWTLPRMAVVIERKTGARYHPGHVWRVLQRLGWSLQRPARRARERARAGHSVLAEALLATTKKNAATLIFMDESGFSEAAVVRRTWAPRGQTPVLHPRGRNLHWMSAMGAIAYHQRSGKACLLLLFQRGAVRSRGCAPFLASLAPARPRPGRLDLGRTQGSPLSRSQGLDRAADLVDRRTSTRLRA